MTENGGQFFGKYRGAVVNPVDPMKKGRLQVKVPDVLGEIPMLWAEPASPYGGTACGMYVVPPPNAGVWIEFEHGDPKYPVWTGFYRDTPGELPPLAMTQPDGVPQVTISTPLGNTLIVSDMPGPTGGIRLQFRTGAYISLSEAGVEIAAGPGLASIRLVGKSVIVNETALIVT